MPLIPDEPVGVLRAPMPGMVEPDPFKQAPGLAATVGAAMRMENPVSNVVDLLTRPTYPEEPGYNPLEAVRGTKYEREHLDDVISIRSSQEMAAFQARVDREEADKRMMHDAGGWGVAAGILAGTLDPLIFLPVGGAIRSVRGGYSVAKSGAQVGALSALQTGVSELAMQAAQETRTAGESIIAIATSGILGGLIGGGAAALLSRAERQAVEGLLDMDRKAVSEIVEGSGPSIGLAQSAGAAAADVRQLKLVGFGLDKIPGVSALVEKMSPTLRVFSSDNVPAKRAMADLAETALRFEDNERGITTSFNGPPISRLVQSQKVSMQLDAAETLKEAFADYRFGAADAKAPIVRAGFDDMRGGAGDGKLGFVEFKREVTTALFSGDVHPVPQVERAAKHIRANILEPIRLKAVELGLLDSDAAPKNDPSWFARVWNKEKIAAARPDVTKRFTDWLEGEQTRKAAAQERLSYISDELDVLDANRAKIEARIERLDATAAQLDGRIAERAMEARRVGKRVDVLEERAALLAQEQSEIEEFISAMRAEARDPALLERVEKLEADYRAMRRQEDAARVSDRDLDRIDREEAAGALSDRVGKMAAEIVLGTRRPTKEPSFLHWLSRAGGLKQEQGDILSVIGTTRAMPGLIRRNGQSLDAMAETIQDAFRLQERPLPNQVLEWIDEASRGRQPAFWLDSMTGKDQAALDATRFAASLDEAMQRAGFDPKTKQDVAAFLRGEDAPGRTLDDLDRALAEMESGAIPPSVKLEGVEGELTLAQADIAAARAAIARGKAGREAGVRRGREVSGRLGEARTGDRVSRGRIGILADQQARAQTKRELLQDIVKLQDAREAEIIGRMEGELQEWGGKSASEALSVIKAREKAAADRPADAARLASADKPTLSAVRRILGSDRNLSRQELESRSNEIIDRLLGTPDGRLPYDAASGGPKSAMAPETGEPRGSLKSRDFAIPTALVRDLVEDDVEHVLSTVTRTLLPDMAIIERFGDVDMTKQMKEIMEASAAKSAAAGSDPKVQTAINKERDGLLRDLAATRDRIRGTYGMAADSTGRNVARFASLAKSVNVATDLGTAALNSMADASGTVFRHGFVNVFRDGWAPFFQRMLTTTPGTASDMRQLRAMNIAVETQLNLRQHAVSDIADNYRPGSRFERTAQWMADKSQLVNGQAFWTDWVKSIAATTGSAEILRAAERVAAGTASAKQIANLAESGIDDAMARKIHAAYANGGGKKIDGARLPNTSDWTDRRAAQAFESALQRETDIAVVTPGLEKPLWMSRPLAGMLGQFKGFIAAANERMLIANLQRSDWNSLQGLVASIALGMLSYRLYTLVSGQKASERPQDWIKEGINRAGVLGWFDEINAMSGKVTRGQADIYRLIGADKPLSRMQSRGILGTLAGPTAGKIEKMAQITGAAASGEWTASDTTAVRRLVPFQNLFYIRGLLDEVEKGANASFGIPAREPR